MITGLLAILLFDSILALYVANLSSSCHIWPSESPRPLPETLSYELLPLLAYMIRNRWDEQRSVILNVQA